MTRIFTLLFFTMAVVLPPPLALMAYPGVEAEGGFECSLCHDSKEYSGRLAVKLLLQQGGRTLKESVLRDGRIEALLKKGSRVSYKLVLADTGGKARVIGWQWELPAGVALDAPGGVRKPNQGQPWNEYMNGNGRMEKPDGATVADQTFFFAPGATGQSVEARLHVALGDDGRGAGSLSGRVISVVFREAR